VISNIACLSKAKCSSGGGLIFSRDDLKLWCGESRHINRDQNIILTRHSVHQLIENATVSPNPVCESSISSFPRVPEAGTKLTIRLFWDGQFIGLSRELSGSFSGEKISTELGEKFGLCLLI
jgi:hypothetical protein